MPPTPNWKLETNGSFRSRNTLAGSSLVAWQGILAVHDCKLSGLPLGRANTRSLMEKHAQQLSG